MYLLEKAMGGGEDPASAYEGAAAKGVVVDDEVDLVGNLTCGGP